MDEDERNPAQMEEGLDDLFPLVFAQGIVVRPGVSSVCHQNLPSYGPLSQGVPPYDRNVERRKRLRWMEDEGCGCGLG